MLKYAIENDMIDIDTIKIQIEMNEKKKYLGEHPYKIWEGKDGLWHTYLPDEEKGRKHKKRKTKQEIEECIIKYWKSKEEEPYLERVFYEWANKKLEYGEIMKQTYDRYETDFIRFIKNNPISKIKVKDIDEDYLEDFIKKTIYENQLTAKAWGNLRTVLIGVFKYAKKHKYTHISIKMFLSDIEISPKSFKKVIVKDEEQVFTDAEVEKIVNFVRSREMTLINLGIVLAFQTGLRAGELSALQWENIDKNLISVKNMEERYKEDGKYVFRVRQYPKSDAGIRKIIITDGARQTLKLIRKINPFGEYLFMANNERIKSKAFTVKLEKICKYVGILPRSLHKARKTYGTKLITAGVNPKLITNQMGHADFDTTIKYYNFNNQSISCLQDILNKAVNY